MGNKARTPEALERYKEGSVNNIDPRFDELEDETELRELLEYQVEGLPYNNHTPDIRRKL